LFKICPLIALRKGFQINRLVPDDESAFMQRLPDDVQTGLIIIKSDYQDVGLSHLMFFDAVNFSQDSPYPSFGASRETTGNGQLQDSFLSADQSHLRQNKN